MKYDLHRPVPGARPLIGGVESLDASRNSSDSAERDEGIIQLLREKLRDRRPGGRPAEDRTPGPKVSQGEDKYEPQRLSRRICWQYDSSARKVPLLRRHYI